MPQFTNADRKMIEAESTLWIVWSMLDDIENAGEWDGAIEKLRDSARRTAEKIRTYNNQFEEE